MIKYWYIYRIVTRIRNVLEEDENKDRAEDRDDVGGVFVLEESPEEAGEELLDADGDIREDKNRHSYTLYNENQVRKVHKWEHLSLKKNGGCR